MNWQRSNHAAQTGMHAAMMFFFITLGILALKCLPVVHHIDATVTDAGRVVLSIGGTAAQLRDASKKESAQLATVTAQVNDDLKQLHAVLVSLKNTADSLNAAVKTANGQVEKIGPVLDETKKTVAAVQPVLANLSTATGGVAKVTNDPNIPKILAHAETMTNDGAAITTHYRKVITAPIRKAKAMYEATLDFLGHFFHIP